MREHTPGPWGWCGFPDRPSIGFDVTCCESGKKIAEIGPPKHLRWADEAYANAVLVAAAPEMLESLCIVRRQMLTGDNTDIAALLDAVIAKATGGKQ